MRVSVTSLSWSEYQNVWRILGYLWNKSSPPKIYDKIRLNSAEKYDVIKTLYGAERATPQYINSTKKVLHYKAGKTMSTNSMNGPNWNHHRSANTSSSCSTLPPSQHNRHKHPSGLAAKAFLALLTNIQTWSNIFKRASPPSRNIASHRGATTRHSHAHCKIWKFAFSSSCSSPYFTRAERGTTLVI